MSDAYHIVCPHCDSINRVPSDKLNAGGKCGRCGKSLFDGTPLELTQQNFQRHILKSDIPVLVDFWAPWCGPCQMMAPVFTEAASKLQPVMRVAKVNTEEQQMLASQYQIRSIPTIAVFKHGQEIGRTAGAMDLNSLTQWARQFI